MPREDTEDVPKPPVEKTEVRSVLGLDNPFDDDDGSTRVRPISSDTDPLIGVEAGEYRILSALGVGSMGLVYKGAHQTNGRVVAIKVLKRALIADPSQQRRFLDEARAVAACNHPGIIDVFSVGQLASDEPYLVMEFLEGEPLDARLARDKRLTVDEVLEFGIAIASALQAAHAVGVIHRDIKPPNIFLVKKREGGFTPKLIDFGLAQRVQGGERHEQTSIGGTPLYLAPEQARRQPITPQADLYSFGCVLFELLSGKPPFTAGNLHALLDQHASLAPVPLRELVTDVPRPLEKLVLSMLAKAPDDRPESAEVVRKELETIRSERTAPSGMALRRPAPPQDEKTTVSFVHQPREGVSTEPEGVSAATRRLPDASAPEAPTTFELKPLTSRGPAATEPGAVAATNAELEPVPSRPRESAEARLARLNMPTLDSGADDPVPPTADAPPIRRRTGEHKPVEERNTGARAAARVRTGEHGTSSPDADSSSRPTTPLRRTGEQRSVEAPRARTGEHGVESPRARTGEQRSVEGPRARTGEHGVESPRARTGEQRSVEAPRARTGEVPAEPRPRTGSVRAQTRSRTGEERAVDEANPSAGSKERRPPRAASQSGVPVAPAPAPESNKLVVLVIIAAAVVLALAIAIALKVTNEPETPPRVPTLTQPKNPVPVEPTPVEATPVEPTPVEPTPVEPTPVEPKPVEPKPVETPPTPKVTAQQVAEKYKKLSARMAGLPRATRTKAQRQLKELKGCSQPPETCLQQLEKLEKKWFKK